MRKLLVLIVLILIAIKIGFVLARGPSPIVRDANGYWELSSKVLDGDVMMVTEPIAYRTPMYPWIISVVRLVSRGVNLEDPQGESFQGEPWALAAIIAIQGLLWFGSFVIAGILAARITKIPIAMLLTLVASLPMISALTFGATLLSETLFVFLLMLHLLTLPAYARMGMASKATLVGATFALALLTRPIVMLLFIPHVLLILQLHFRCWRERKLRATRTRLHQRIGHAILAVGVAAIIVSPWIARNVHVFGQPFLTEFVGRNIWIVTFQDGSGAGLEIPTSRSGNDLNVRLSRMGAAEQWRETWAVSNALVESGLDDAQADRLMKQVSLDAVNDAPETFAKETIRRIGNFWRTAATDLPVQSESGEFHGQKTWQHQTPTVEWAIEHRFSQSVLGNTLLFVALLIALGVIIWRAQSRPYGLWLALILAYFAVITGVFEIPAYRYRIVIEPLVAVAFGSTAAILFQAWRSSKNGSGNVPTVPAESAA